MQKTKRPLTKGEIIHAPINTIMRLACQEDGGWRKVALKVNHYHWMYVGDTGYYDCIHILCEGAWELVCYPEDV